MSTFPAISWRDALADNPLEAMLAFGGLMVGTVAAGLALPPSPVVPARSAIRCSPSPSPPWPSERSRLHYSLA